MISDPNTNTSIFDDFTILSGQPRWDYNAVKNLAGNYNLQSALQWGTPNRNLKLSDYVEYGYEPQNNYKSTVKLKTDYLIKKFRENFLDVSGINSIEARLQASIQIRSNYIKKKILSYLDRYIDINSFNNSGEIWLVLGYSLLPVYFWDINPEAKYPSQILPSGAAKYKDLIEIIHTYSTFGDWQVKFKEYIKKRDNPQYKQFYEFLDYYLAPHILKY